MGIPTTTAIPTRPVTAPAAAAASASRTPQNMATTTALALTSTFSTLFAVAQLSKAHPPHYLWAVLAAGLATTALLLDLALVALCGALPVRVLALVFCTVATLVSFAFACVWGGETWAVYAACGVATVIAAHRVVSLWPRERSHELVGSEVGAVGRSDNKAGDMCCESTVPFIADPAQSVLYDRPNSVAAYARCMCTSDSLPAST